MICMAGKKTKEDVVKFVTMTATKQKWVLHPDKTFLDMLIDG